MYYDWMMDTSVYEILTWWVMEKTIPMLRCTELKTQNEQFELVHLWCSNIWKSKKRANLVKIEH